MNSVEQISWQKLFNTAMKASARNQKEEAAGLLLQVIEIDKDNDRAYNELGVIYYQLNRRTEAKRCFTKAVELNPENAKALTNLGACYNDAGKNEKAVSCYEKALSIDPKLTNAWGNLGKLWIELREFENSVYCYRQAMQLEARPNYLRGLSFGYRQSGRLTRAKELFQQALALDPDDHIAHFGLAPLHFYLEEYPEALREYEWRWRQDKMVEHQNKHPAIFAKPAWSGEDLADKTLLLHTEQGFGDCLLFARFIPLIRPRVKRLVMWCWPGLAKLFRENFDIDEVTGNSAALPYFDYQLPLLSIPHHLDPQLETIKRFTPYLSAKSGRSAPLKKVPKKLNVGIVWSCDPNGFDYAHKKLSLDQLNPLLSLPGIAWHSLQVGKDRSDLQKPGMEHIADVGERLTDFHATAQAVDKLDLVISVDTAVAHLAGAMGKAVWVLLKRSPDWRWHGRGENALWYPGARLYHQYSHGDWKHVINRMAGDLIALVAKKTGTAK